MKTPPIKLLAIDLDGTLLDSSKKISKKTLAALKCLPKDVRIIIASARPPRSVRSFYQSLGLDTWQINYNGALIWDEPANRAVYHRPMPGQLARQIIDSAREIFKEILISCEIMDRLHTDRLDNSFTTETSKLFEPDVIAPHETFCNQPVTKVLLLGDPKKLDQLKPIIQKKFGQKIAIVQTDNHLLEIVNKNVSKAAALKIVAKHYNIALNQILAIGDASNDISMLQMSGIAVAMDNAHESVKKVADWIAPSNNDHGVHAALVKYGLCK